MFLKRQKLVIVALTLIILALGAGIYLNRSRFFGKSEAPASANYYQRIRSASPSLSASLIWEQTVGGSRDEFLVNAFKINGKLYVFGNTESDDLDMTGITKGFMAILTDGGQTVNFLPIGDAAIENVSIAEGGFLVTTAYPSSKALLVDYDGKITKSLTLFSVPQITRQIALNDGGYSILSTSSTAGGKSVVTVTLISKALELIYQSVTSEAYSLNPLDVYCIGEQTVVFCHAEGADDRLAVGIFTKGASPLIRYVTDGDGYLPFRVLPYKNGWAVCAIDGLKQAFILKLSFSYASLGKLLFNIGDCVRCDMSFCNGAYYVFANRSVGGFLATVNGDISDSTIRTQSENYTYFNDYRILRALSLSSGIKMGVIDNEIVKVPLTSATATRAILVEEFLIYEGNGGHGKKDITVCLTDV